MAKKKKTKKKKITKSTKKKKAVTKTVKRKAKTKKTKPSKLKSAIKKQKPSLPAGQIVGTVTHYFPHVQAAVIKLKKPLATGDTVHIKGKTTDFEQKVESMQIDHVPVQKAKKGDEIGLQVTGRVREHDVVILPD